MLVALRSALLFLQIIMDLYLVFLLGQPGNSECRYVVSVFAVVEVGKNSNEWVGHQNNCHFHRDEIKKMDYDSNIGSDANSSEG